MTALLAAARGLLWGVLVADSCLAVFWAWAAPPGLRTIVSLAVITVIAAVAAVLLAALPNRPNRPNRRNHDG
jgi:hypothetical protein